MSAHVLGCHSSKGVGVVGERENCQVVKSSKGQYFASVMCEGL